MKTNEHFNTWRPMRGCSVWKQIDRNMAENDEKLKRLNAIRSGNRAVATQYTKEAVELLNEEKKSVDLRFMRRG